MSGEGHGGVGFQPPRANTAHEGQSRLGFQIKCLARLKELLLRSEAGGDFGYLVQARKQPGCRFQVQGFRFSGSTFQISGFRFRGAGTRLVQAAAHAPLLGFGVWGFANTLNPAHLDTQLRPAYPKTFNRVPEP